LRGKTPLGSSSEEGNYSNNPNRYWDPTGHVTQNRFILLASTTQKMENPEFP